MWTDAGMVPRLAPRRLRGHFSRRDVATTVTYTDETTLTKFTDPIAYKQVTASVGFRWFM